jgi:uncharacterized membrane protein
VLDWTVTLSNAVKHTPMQGPAGSRVTAVKWAKYALTQVHLMNNNGPVYMVGICCSAGPVESLIIVEDNLKEVESWLGSSGSRGA